MTEMVKRGAMYLLNQERELDEVPVDDLSRGVLFAALDPEDEALVADCAQRLLGDGPLDMTDTDAARCVRVIIRALKSEAAQGESSLSRATDGQEDTQP